MTPFSLLAVVLAIIIARRAPAHRPIAWALVLAKLAELVRPELPSRPAMVLLLVLPAFSTWSTLRALAWVRAGRMCAGVWMLAACWVLFGPRPGVWWEFVWPIGLGTAATIEAWAWWRWRRSDAISGVTQRTAAVLSSGDVGGFLIGVCFGFATKWLAEGVAIGTCVAQVLWLWQQRELRGLVENQSADETNEAHLGAGLGAEKTHDDVLFSSVSSSSSVVPLSMSRRSRRRTRLA